jgi:ABC-type Fe3+-hydroxamate transport system substrate-binding protein
MKIFHLIALLLVTAATIGCTSNSEVVSEVRVTSDVAEQEMQQPFPTAPIITVTPQIVVRDAPSYTPYADVQAPAKEPLVEFYGIPVLPSAIVAKDGWNAYFYLADSELWQAQDFYLEEMAQLGWSVGLYWNEYTDQTLDMVKTTFFRADGKCTVSLIPQSDGPLYVILTWHW